MWRWIAAVTVLVGTFGLGMWSAFCIGAPRASIDIVWEPDASWQRHDVDFDFEVATSAPAYACEQCPSASNEPNKICEVDALPCPEPLPENVQRVVEIARSRPSAAAGTIFDDTANDVAFVDALTEVAEQTQRKAMPIVDDPRLIGDGPRDPQFIHGSTHCQTTAADGTCPLGTSGGCPLAVNDATTCAGEATCEVVTCENTVCDTTACAKGECETTATDKSACDSVALVNTALCETATCSTKSCEAGACTAEVCDSTCDQATGTKECRSAEAVTALLYERAREMDAKAWELEEAGEYGLADRLRDIANEMRDSARVARQAATGLR